MIFSEVVAYAEGQAILFEREVVAIQVDKTECSGKLQLPCAGTDAGTYAPSNVIAAKIASLGVVHIFFIGEFAVGVVFGKLLVCRKTNGYFRASEDADLSAVVEVEVIPDSKRNA